MKTLTLMSLLMAAFSINTFAASNQCQTGSNATAASSADAKKADKDSGDAVDLIKSDASKEQSK